MLKYIDIGQATCLHLWKAGARALKKRGVKAGYVMTEELYKSRNQNIKYFNGIRSISQH
jgi:hypothetical protein